MSPPRLSFALRAVWLMAFERERGAERMARYVAGGQPVAEEAIQYSALIAKAFNPRMSLPLLSDAEITTLTMPTLLIVGARDPLLNSAKTRARLERLAPHLETAWLPEAGHVLVGQTAQVLAFLGAGDAAAG